MQSGRLNVTEIPMGWNCNNCQVPEHCTLPRCTNVVFPTEFTGLGKVSVQKKITTCFDQVSPKKVPWNGHGKF